MGRKQSRPGRGMGQRNQNFSNWKVPFSFKIQKAWMAGKAEWYECHEHTEYEPGTKVCLNWYTDGALRCPRCRARSKLSTIAYVPLYREVDTKPSFVICHEGVADLLEGLQYKDYVDVGRVDGGSSIFVKLSSDERPFSSTLPARQQACDLLPSLLTVWDYRELDQWCISKGWLRPYSHLAPVDVSKVPTESLGTTALDTEAVAELLDDQATKARQRAEQAERNADFVRGIGRCPNDERKPKPS